ncbi:winged helix-turn-helix transcriptional regulator [Allosphingosinicella deserti]|uniref:Transcriptional regulator n=1 Tax=Allosphingosinicella deserti TaxID=2116704 RepID=A0A2P7QRE9_9SPHN|nr:helix-turn-helix domain-containing protein [Sphingomonas deserti]PSJ40524.1 transcriptional regulator [Sphingomonas deserti]
MKLENVTSESPGRGPRRYDDACGAAHALDLVGERWALLVIRELMFGPKRFGDLKADLAGISANVLTQRLESLEASGILVRRKLPPPASIQVYELTPWGYEAEPIFQALGRWAARSPSHDPRLPLSAVSLLLSFRTMVDPARIAGLALRVRLQLGREAYLVRIADGMLDVARSDAAEADAVLTAAPPAIAAAVYAGVPLAALEAEGALAIEGDRAAAERFVRLFVLPPKAAKDG